MITGMDKAIQDFIISLVAILGFFGFDVSQWQNVAVSVGGAFAKAAVTFWIPNKP